MPVNKTLKVAYIFGEIIGGVLECHYIKLANKKMINSLSLLLSATDLLQIHGKYIKLWLYRTIVSLLHFHLSVDAITKSAVSKLENLATRYLKK